jgi:uncharacterized protein
LSQGAALGHTQRIRIIDIIRGVAVLGIFTMNAADMAYPEHLVLDFHAADPGGGWNYQVAFISELLFSGKMRGLFTLLFGVSSVLVFQRITLNAGGKSAVHCYFRRLCWLLTFGLVNAYILLWWGDVLFKYALLGMLLFPARLAPNRFLLAGVLACLAALTVPLLLEYRDMSKLEQRYMDITGGQHSLQSLSSDENETLLKWRDVQADAEPDQEWIEEEIQAKSGNYAGIFAYNLIITIEEQTSVFYEEDIWDMLLYMLLGIILLRADFFSDRVSRNIHLTIALSGVGLGLGIHLWLNLGVYANFLNPVRSLYYLAFYDLGRIPFVLGYASMIILIFRLEISRRVGDWMQAAGRMALSNYLMQSVIGALVFYGFGLAQFNSMSRLELAAFVFLVCIFQLTFSVIWMKRFHYGPAEWLWRSLTYWKLQPLRRTVT